MAVLKKGSKGPEVSALQKKLNLYKPSFNLDTDGDFGQGTHNAVVAFQKEVGLVADGIVGNGTADKLDRLLLSKGSIPNKSGKVTLEKIYSVFPNAKKEYVEYFLKYLDEINFPESNRPMLFAQAGHETGGFTKFEESTNYSAQGLSDTWPTRYAKKDKEGKYLKVPNPKNPKVLINVPNDLALQLHRKPEEIANHTYANRMGNGAPETGDGWANRGRGHFQLTGNDNYVAFAKDHPELNVLKNKDIVATPEGAAKSAVWFWKRNGLDTVANDIVASTKKINGGTIGLDDRKHHFEMLA